jgi:hypothetical protein
MGLTIVVKVGIALDLSWQNVVKQSLVQGYEEQVKTMANRWPCQACDTVFIHLLPTPCQCCPCQKLVKFALPWFFLKVFTSLSM